MSLMIIDPSVKGIYSTYPFLKGLGETDENVFRYLSYAYDPNSPLVRMFPDIRTRKEEARRRSGYKGECSNLTAIKFVKNIIKKPLWVLVVSLDNTFDEYADRVNSPIDMEEDDKALKAVELKNKMLTQMSDMLKTRDNLIKQLFDNDRDLEDAESEMKEFKPELIGKKLGRGNVSTFK